MDLVDWKCLLWRVVESELYDPAHKLYLCFDDPLLTSAAGKEHVAFGADTPSDSLNLAIGAHTEKLAQSGKVGLKRDAFGPASRNNWRWVLLPSDDGRSFALAFAAQQILAAERMRGQSYYAAYWDMLGYSTDEVRVNPFGDIGFFSFTKIWRQLANELRVTLGVSPNQITFGPGQGSNKFRNYPISQSLLNLRDLRAIAEVVGSPRDRSDDVLHYLMQKVRLSRSGSKKIFVASIRPAIVNQYREYWSVAAEYKHGVTRAPRKKTRQSQRVSADPFLLWEYQEPFEENCIFCGCDPPQQDFERRFLAYFEQHDFLLFRSTGAEIRGSNAKVLLQPGEEVWLACSEESFRGAARELRELRDYLRLEEQFVPQNASIPNEFRVYSCAAVPRSYCGTDFSVAPIGFSPRLHSAESGLTFLGGVCLNHVSKAYLMGFPPTNISINGALCERMERCELDHEPCSLGEALNNLARLSTESKHVLTIRGTDAYLELLTKRNVEFEPAFFATKWAVFSAPEIAAAQHDIGADWTVVGSVIEEAKSFWIGNRVSEVARLRSSLVDGQQMWIRVSRRMADLCVSLLRYICGSGELEAAMRKRIVATRTIPWAFYVEGMTWDPASRSLIGIEEPQHSNKPRRGSTLEE